MIEIRRLNQKRNMIIDRRRIRVRTIINKNDDDHPTMVM
jgi:hypothetical protein